MYTELSIQDDLVSHIHVVSYIEVILHGRIYYRVCIQCVLCTLHPYFGQKEHDF
jgi:hypothetical protein